MLSILISQLNKLKQNINYNSSGLDKLTVPFSFHFLIALTGTSGNARFLNVELRSKKLVLPSNCSLSPGLLLVLQLPGRRDSHN